MIGARRGPQNTHKDRETQKCAEQTPPWKIALAFDHGHEHGAPCFLTTNRESPCHEENNGDGTPYSRGNANDDALQDII